MATPKNTETPKPRNLERDTKAAVADKLKARKQKPETPRLTNEERLARIEAYLGLGGSEN